MSTQQERQPIEQGSAVAPGTLEKARPAGAQCDSPPRATEQVSSARTGPLIVVPALDAARAPIAPRRSLSTASQLNRAQVHVALNLRELLTAPPAQPVVAAHERRDPDKVIHAVLIVGLVISIALMLTGIGLDLLAWRTTPIAVPNIDDGFGRLTMLHPFGFLAVGLFILILTPILSVSAAILVLLYERDWRYAGITTLVLVIFIVSLLVGSD